MSLKNVYWDESPCNLMEVCWLLGKSGGFIISKWKQHL